jgi:uncharacterized membrane protein
MGYVYFKLIHIAAVVVYLGNMISSLFWMHNAVKSGEVPIINHTLKSIKKSDGLFTIPAVIVITASGFLTAIYGHFPILRTGWIFWSLVLFSFSGLAYSFRIVSLQNNLFLHTQQFSNATEFNLFDFQKKYKAWQFWLWFALITPIIAFVLMTIKTPRLSFSF